MSRSKLSIIAALGHNRAIGIANGLPWELPDDHDWFRNTTAGHPFIMGRKSYVSPDAFLSDQHNYILTRRPQLELCEKCTQVSQLASAVELSRAAFAGEIFVIGGASVYAQALRLCDKLYLTHVDAEPEGDAFFPQIAPHEWQTTFEEFHPQDERHAYSFTFRIYERR
ncbi:MAG: dihydrofolate reductase [Bacteroidota bacterium]